MLLLSGAGWLHAEEASDPGPRDRSTCLVQLGVLDDHFIVQGLELDLKGRFPALVSSAQQATLERDLTALLNTMLHYELPLSVWARADADIRAYVRSDPRAVGATLAGRQDWDTANSNLNATGAVRSLAELVSLILRKNGPFDDALTEDTPLRLDMVDLNEQTNLIEEGKLKLILLDPIAPEDIAIDALRFGDTDRAARSKKGENSRLGADRSELHALLRPLTGRLWIRREIKVRIADYYRQRGVPALEPVHVSRKIAATNQALLDRNGTNEAIDVQNVLGVTWKTAFSVPDFGLIAIYFEADSSRRFRIAEPYYINSVTMALADDRSPDLDDKLLYAILDEADWRAVRQNGGVGKRLKKLPVVEGLPTGASQPALYSFSIETVRRKDRKLSPPYYCWLLTDQDLQHRAHTLATLGYSVVLANGKERRASLYLSPVPRKQVDAEMEKTKPEALRDADAEPVEETVPVPANADEPDEPTDTEKTSKPRVIAKEYRNFAQGSVSFSEGRGVEVQGAYRRVLLTDRSAAATFEAGEAQEPFGNMTLQKDFFLFDRIHRRMQVDLKTYSDFAPDQPAAAARADERRTGAHVGVEMEIRRARSGAWLVGRLEATREQVTSEPAAGGPKTSRYDSSVSLGATYFWKNPKHLSAPDITLNATCKAVRSGGTDFSVWQLDGRYHRLLGSFLQTEIAGKIAHATSATPFTDLPQLGGSESVRGYREDVATGQTVGFARAELWFPLRALETRWPAFGPALRKQFVAVFADLGILRNNSGSHTLAGVGLGLRLRPYPDTVLKIDVARGLTDAGAVRRLTRVHFDVAVDFPF